MASAICTYACTLYTLHALHITRSYECDDETRTLRIAVWGTYSLYVVLEEPGTQSWLELVGEVLLSKPKLAVAPISKRVQKATLYKPKQQE